MIESVNLQEVKMKLYQRLFGTGWDNLLKSFILSSDMDHILEQLLEEAKDGKRFTPQIKNIFRAFEECPLDTTKVVMILQDPYFQRGVASGIALSCDFTDSPQPSLTYVLKAVRDTVYPGTPVSKDYNLMRWSHQGVLMLNTALTTTIGKPGSHQALWKPFTTFLLDSLIWNKQDLVYTFMGAKAKEFSDIIPENNCKFFCTHPAFASHQMLESWDCNDVFNKINNCLTNNKLDIIQW